MRIEKLTESGRVWYMAPGAYERALMATVPANAAAPPKDAAGGNARRPDRDVWGDAIAKTRFVQDVAIVPITGPLLKGATASDKFYGGFMSHEDVHEDLESARTKAKAIVLHVNSPGGSVQGTHELAQRVAQIRKGGLPIYAYTEDQMCSAAEYITAGCVARFATGDAIVGSIGTMVAVVSFEKMLGAMGISFNVFTSGKFKAMGHQAKDLSKDQETFLQGFVNARAAEFKAHMVQYRNLKPETMQGQIFTGSEAAENGLIDGTVSSLEEVLSLVR